MLPTHRLCKQCGRVLTLDATNFYETQRYPWNLSRFSSACRSCRNRRSTADLVARRAAVNAVVRSRRALVKANKRNAAFFYTPAWLAIKEQRETADAARRLRLAESKRQFNRLRGPYRDPIKALIIENQRAAYRRRLETQPEPETRQPLDAEQNDYLATLKALQDKHAAEAPSATRAPGHLPFGAVTKAL